MVVHGSFLGNVLQPRPASQECQGGATQLPDNSQSLPWASPLLHFGVAVDLNRSEEGHEAKGTGEDDREKVDGRAQSSASTVLPTEVATAREDAPRAIHEHTKGAAGGKRKSSL